MSCDRHYGIIGLVTCSGNGECVNGLCVCKSGWSSIGDMQLIDGVDCDIHIPTIQILSILYIIVAFPGLVYLLASFRTTTGLYNTRTALQVSILVIYINGYIYSIVKIIDPIKYIFGRSILLAFVQSSFLTSACVVDSLYSLLMLKFLRGYYKMLRIDRKEKLNKYSSIWSTAMYMTPIFVFISLLVIVFAAIYSDPKYCDHINIGVYGLLNVAVTIYLLCRWSISKIFISEIHSILKSQCIEKSVPSVTGAITNYHDQHLNMLIQLRTLLQSSVRIFTLILVFLVYTWLINFLFMIWPFIRRKESYQIPVLFLLLSAIAPFYLQVVQSIASKHVESNAFKSQISSNKTLPIISIKVSAPRVELPKQPEIASQNKVNLMNEIVDVRNV